MFLGGYPENIESFKLSEIQFYNYRRCMSCFGAKYNFNNKNIPVGSCTHSFMRIFISSCKNHHNR